MFDGLAPDALGPITGFRRWSVSRGRLGSILWIPHRWDAPEEAQHVVEVGGVVIGAHRAPAEHCICGLYAMSTAEAMIRETSRVSMDMGYEVVGEVTLWGRVWLHEHGYRAEFARPKTLWRTWSHRQEKSMKEIADFYGAEIVDPPDEFAEYLRLSSRQWQWWQSSPLKRWFIRAAYSAVVALHLSLAFAGVAVAWSVSVVAVAVYTLVFLERDW